MGGFSLGAGPRRRGEEGIPGGRRRRTPANLRAALGARLVLPAVYRDAADLEANDASDSRRGSRSCTRRWIALHAARGPTPPSSARAGPISTSPTRAATTASCSRAMATFIARVLRPSLPEFFADRPPPRAKGACAWASSATSSSTAPSGATSRAGSATSTARASRRSSSTRTPGSPTTRAPSPRRPTDSTTSRAHPLHAIARRVAAEELDVLVYPELGMHADTFALAALRLAPVQVAGWGHPTTTGLASIDAFLSCAEMEPEGAQDAYRERLVGLPGIGTRYRRPRAEARREREELGLAAGAARSTSARSRCSRSTRTTTSCFARVLAGDPGGLLVFFGDRDGPRDARPSGARLVAGARAAPASTRAPHGVPRLHVARRLPAGERALRRDARHACTGPAATPRSTRSPRACRVVTLPGALHARAPERRDAAHASASRSWWRSDRDDYVRIALRLGTDAAWRREVSAGASRTRSGALFDQQAPGGGVRGFPRGGRLGRRPPRPWTLRSGRLFASAFVSSTILPGNSEIVLVAVLKAGGSSPAAAVGVATIGNTLGGLTTYGIGRLLPSRIPEGQGDRARAALRGGGAALLLDARRGRCPLRGRRVAAPELDRLHARHGRGQGGPLRAPRAGRRAFLGTGHASRPAIARGQCCIAVKSPFPPVASTDCKPRR